MHGCKGSLHSVVRAQACQAILELVELSEGKSLSAICRESWAPNRRQIYKWVENDAEFCKRYMIARELRRSKPTNIIYVTASDFVRGCRRLSSDEKSLFWRIPLIIQKSPR